MVLLHVKRSEEDQFLYEVPAETVIAEALRQVVAISNLRHKIQRLHSDGLELAEKGPAAPEDKEASEDLQGLSLEEGLQNEERPTAIASVKRIGNACAPEQTERLKRALAEAQQVQSKDQVARKAALTEDMLLEAVDGIRAAVLEACPDGLPEHDPVRRALDGTEDLAGTKWEERELQADHAELWFASKKLPADGRLSQHVGRNEKTKAIVKLQQAGWGRPPREAVLDEQTQKAMLAYYHKKQQEQEKMAADDTYYYDAEWANPKALKRHFHGISDDVRLA